MMAFVVAGRVLENLARDANELSGVSTWVGWRYTGERDVVGETGWREEVTLSKLLDGEDILPLPT